MIPSVLRRVHTYHKNSVFCNGEFIQKHSVTGRDPFSVFDIRVFPQLPDLTFLSFLYKIDITGFQNQPKKIRIPAPLPTQPICQSMPASNFQTLLKSCSLKPEMIKVQFMNLLFNKCLGG